MNTERANPPKDPSLFRAQAAEEQVRQLREQNTALRVTIVHLSQELQDSRQKLARVAEETAENLRTAKELLEKEWQKRGPVE
jgi:predicted RNase H-like nuclease (RuvC/YqgF family)